MTTQTLLKNIETRIKNKKSPAVVLSLKEWRQIEDIISELSSPKLIDSVKKARQEYKKAKPYRIVRNGLLK